MKTRYCYGYRKDPPPCLMGSNIMIALAKSMMMLWMVWLFWSPTSTTARAYVPQTLSVDSLFMFVLLGFVDCETWQVTWIDVDDAYLLASYSDAWTGEASTHARLAPCIFLGCKHHLQYAYPGQTCDHGEGADLGFLSSEVKCLLATFFWTLSFIHVSSWDLGRRSWENHKVLAHWS